MKLDGENIAHTPNAVMGVVGLEKGARGEKRSKYARSVKLFLGNACSKYEYRKRIIFKKNIPNASQQFKKNTLF